MQSVQQLGYGMDYTGFESLHWNEIFLISDTSRPALGHIFLPVQWVPAFFPGGKAVVV